MWRNRGNAALIWLRRDSTVHDANAHTVWLVFLRFSIFGIGAVVFTYRRWALPFRSAPCDLRSIERLPRGAIAFDMDFPALLRQAGKQHTDLLIVPIVPADDSREIAPLHSKMTAFRAIENGFNLMLHPSNGLSRNRLSGYIYRMMDHFQTTYPVMVAQAPTRGVTRL